jgi:hypothetical protein
MEEQMEEQMSLPYNVFFSPTDEFLKWAKGYIRTHMVIDCGAGSGHLSANLKKYGMNVLPIDIYQRNKCDTPVIFSDSTTFNFPSRSIAIIARPNRGIWIRKTIDHALETTSAVLYIGIEEHYDEDLMPLLDDGYAVQALFNNAGKDGEGVFEIRKGGKKMSNKRTYCLVKYEICKNIFSVSWFEDGGDRWNNYAGGYCPKCKKDEILQTCKAEDIYELDWTLTDIINNKWDSGWIDRNGKFYGCNSRMHDTVVDLVFNKTVQEFEDTGWVRVYSKSEWVCRKRLSADQRNTLSRKGHIVRDDD